MKKLLIIDATGRNEYNSRTKLLSNTLLSSINTRDCDITTLDLYNMEIPFLTQEILESRISKTYVTENQKYANDIVTQFESSDIIIFIYPIWNWSVPSILKAYIDLIMISNRNFTYKGMKIVGLLENKKAIFISTGGGPLMGSISSKLFNLENPNLYMQKMMRTLGIKDTITITVGSMSYKFKNKEKELKFDIDLYKNHIQKIIEKNETKINEFLQ